MSDTCIFQPPLCACLLLMTNQKAAITQEINQFVHFCWLYPSLPETQTIFGTQAINMHTSRAQHLPRPALHGANLSSSGRAVISSLDFQPRTWTVLTGRLRVFYLVCLINMHNIPQSRRGLCEFVSVAEAVLRNRSVSWLCPQGMKEQFKRSLKLANIFCDPFWIRITSLVTRSVHLVCFAASPGVCLCRSLSSAAAFVLKWLWLCSHTDPAPQRESESGAGVSDAISCLLTNDTPLTDDCSAAWSDCDDAFLKLMTDLSELCRGNHYGHKARS